MLQKLKIIREARPSDMQLIGKQRGTLTVLQVLGRNCWSRPVVVCQCTCGRTGPYEWSNKLMYCSNKVVHPPRMKYQGLSDSRLYRTWCDMKTRCYNSNHPSYKWYGARGITICDTWRNDFMAFYSWAMLSGYQENLTIDRIDVNGNYEPDNCRWSTMLEQSHNKRPMTGILCTSSGYSVRQIILAAGLCYSAKNRQFVRDAILKCPLLH